MADTVYGAAQRVDQRIHGQCGKMIEDKKYEMLQRWFSPDEIIFLMHNEAFRNEFTSATSVAALDDLINRGISMLPSWSPGWVLRSLNVERMRVELKAGREFRENTASVKKAECEVLERAQTKVDSHRSVPGNRNLNCEKLRRKCGSLQGLLLQNSSGHTYARHSWSGPIPYANQANEISSGD